MQASSSYRSMKPLLSRASPEPSVFRPFRSRSQGQVAPNLLVARTDSVHYHQITPDGYRFFPGVRDQTDIEAVHGMNESPGYCGLPEGGAVHGSDDADCLIALSAVLANAELPAPDV